MQCLKLFVPFDNGLYGNSHLTRRGFEANFYLLGTCLIPLVYASDWCMCCRWSSPCSEIPYSISFFDFICAVGSQSFILARLLAQPLIFASILSRAIQSDMIAFITDINWLLNHHLDYIKEAHLLMLLIVLSCRWIPYASLPRCCVASAGPTTSMF